MARRVDSVSVLIPSDLARPILIWSADVEQSIGAVAECVWMAENDGRMCCVVTTEGSGFQTRLPHLPLLTAGEFSSECPIAFNPFQVLNFADVRLHIEALVTMFAELFRFTAATTTLLRSIIESAYKRVGWNLLSGRNERVRETPQALDADLHDWRRYLSASADSRHASALYPDFNDLLAVLTPVCDQSDLPPYVVADAEGAIRDWIQTMTSGLIGRTFGRRTFCSAEELFSRSCILDLALLSGSSDGRPILERLLLLFACEYFSRGNQHSGVIVLDYSHGDTLNSRNLGLPIRLQNSSRASLIVSARQRDLPKILKSGAFGTRLLGRAELNRLALPKKRRSRIGLTTSGGLERARQFADLASNLVVLRGPRISRLKCVSVPRPRASTGSESPMAKESLPRFRQVFSHGQEYAPAAFDDPVALELARKVANDEHFYRLFMQYVLSMLHDIRAFVSGRTALVHDVQRVVLRAPVRLTDVTWCALCLVTDRYFGEKARQYSWTLQEEDRLRTGWYKMLAKAFLPSTQNRRMHRSEWTQWREEFNALHEVPQGPLLTCGACRVKCRYAVEASIITSDRKLQFDFNSTINRRHVASSTSAAWHSRLLSERMIGDCNTDLAFCLSVHFLEKQALSTDGQLVLLNKVLKALQHFSQNPSIESLDITEVVEAVEKEIDKS